MLELRAILTCDRCLKTIEEIEDVRDETEARKLLAQKPWGCEDEDGNDVCAACWRKFDAQQQTRKGEPVDPRP